MLMLMLRYVSHLSRLRLLSCNFLLNALMCCGAYILILDHDALRKLGTSYADRERVDPVELSC